MEKKQKLHLCIEISNKSVIIHPYSKGSYLSPSSYKKFKKSGNNVERALNAYREHCGFTEDDYVVVDILKTNQKINRGRDHFYKLFRNIYERQSYRFHKGSERTTSDGIHGFVVNAPGYVQWVEIGQEIEFSLKNDGIFKMRLNRHGDAKIFIEPFYTAAEFPYIGEFPYMNMQDTGHSKVDSDRIQRAHRIKQHLIDEEAELLKILLKPGYAGPHSDTFSEISYNVFEYESILNRNDRQGQNQFFPKVSNQTDQHLLQLLKKWQIDQKNN